MGIPTPTYYDQLLLTKCKLLIQAALSNPKRRGGVISFEEFVTGLDAHDESTIRTFEILLQETAVRRPRKTTTATPGDDASILTATHRRRTHASLAVPSVPLLRPEFAAGRRGNNFDSDDDDSDDDTSEDYDFGMRLLDRPPEVVSDGEDELAMSVPGWFAPTAAGSRMVPIRRAPASNARPTTVAAGIPIDRTVATTTTTSGGSGPDAASALTPSDRLRELERGSLFGFDEPSPSFSDLLSHIADDLRPSTRSHPSANPNSGTSSSADYPELPTYQELWSVVTDGEEAFPSESITSFDSFLNRLNATAAVSASSASSTLCATDMNGLLAELTLRDLSIPIRVRNTIARRRGNSNPSGGSRRRGGGATASRDARVTANYDVSPLFEGMWRVPPNVGDSVPSEDAEAGPEASRTSGTTFSDFARRRRALTREREEEGAVVPTEGGTGTSTAMAVESSTTPSTAQQTPQISTPASTLTSPNTSHAASPVASACPAPAEAAPRPLTSADRAIAAMRQQRDIAPLPTSTAVRQDPATGDDVEALGAGQEVEGDLTPNQRMNLRHWVDRMIQRGMEIRYPADESSVEGADSLHRQLQVRELFARPGASSSRSTDAS